MRTQLLLLALLYPAAGAEPAGYSHWSMAEIQERARALSPKIDAHKVATERLATYSNHEALAVHREGSGQAEVHEHWADLFVVQTGTATLVVGGTIPSRRTTAPGEIRGPSIEGGTRQKLSPGDIVHVPARTPHQIVLDPGVKEFDAFVVKIRQ